MLDAIRAGASRTTAAEAAGIGRATLLEWLARGEGRDPDREQTDELATFAVEVRAAESELETSMIAHIRAASEGDRPDWRAAAWLLERRFPDRWGRSTRVEVAGKDGAPILLGGVDLDAPSLSDDQLRRIAAGEPLASVLAPTVPTAPA